MKKIIESAFLMALLALTPVAAAADGPIGNCGNQEDSGTNPNGQGNTCGSDDDDGGDSWGGNAAWFDYGAGGEATNIGETIGDKGYVGSLTTKLIYGGGDAEVSEDDASVNAYAGSHFLTMGIAGSESMGHGGQLAGSAEYGSIFGGGYAAVGTESLEGDDD